MLLHLRTLSCTILALLIFSGKSYAGPQVKLCLDDNCKKPVIIEITDNCWSDIKEIFAPPFPTDKDEQDNIVNSIALIESDVYHSLEKLNPEGNSASDLYTGNSTKNNYRNIKNYLGILLDSYLVNRHFLRKTISQSNWSGFESNALLLQSLTDSKLYTLEANNSELGVSSVIQPYNKTSIGITVKSALDNDNNSPEDDDFE